MNNIKLVRNTLDGEAATIVSIQIPVGPKQTMRDLNDIFKEKIKQELSAQSIIHTTDFVIEYDSKGLHMYINRAPDENGEMDLWLNVDSIESNDETKALFHLAPNQSFANLDERYIHYAMDEGVMSNTKIREINIPDIWDRDDLIVYSSLTDMSYNRYLGLTNTEYHPPKTYTIHTTDNKFWIDLYDISNTKPIELDKDTTLIFETIMYMRDSV